MKLPSKPVDEVVRTYLVAELCDIESMLDGIANKSKEEADRLSQGYGKDFEQAHHKAHASFAREVSATIGQRRRAIEQRYNEGEMMNEEAVKAAQADQDAAE